MNKDTSTVQSTEHVVVPTTIRSDSPPVLSPEELKQFREALVDAVPEKLLNDALKGLVKRNMDVSLIHHEIVKNVCNMGWSDHPEVSEKRILELVAYLCES